MSFCFRALPKRLLDPSLFVLPIALGVIARIQRLGFPHQRTFDEPSFVDNARRLLRGLPDLSDHPPLGKWLLAWGMMLWGDDSSGWRQVPLLSGLAILSVVFVFNDRLFANRGTAWLVTALVALDGFFITYSRTALLDGILALGYATGLLLLVRNRAKPDFLAAAAVAGATACVKWTGATLLLPILVWLLLHRQWRKVPVVMLICTITYGGCFALSQVAVGQSPGPTGLIQEHQRLWREQTQVRRPHFMNSSAVSWLVLRRPLVFRNQPDGRRLRILSTLANPLAYFGSTITMALLALSTTKHFVAYFWHRRGTLGNWFLGREQRVALLLLAAWIGPLLPWLLSFRKGFAYHYLLSYLVALCVLGISLSRLFERRRWLGIAVSCVIFGVGLLYLPFSTQFPVSQRYFELLCPFRSWRGLPDGPPPQ